MHTQENHILDYNQIDKHIFIGTNQCCRSHFEEELVSKGITADISLEAENVDMPFGIDYYLWLPVTDHTAPTLDQLRVGVSVFTTLISLGKKIYVHCKNGHGRAPTLVAAYYIMTGMAVDEAIATIQKRRAVVHLALVQHAVLKDFSLLITSGNVQKSL